jgi:hypothetical protein
MKTIKFELEDNYEFCPQYCSAKISLNDDTIESYLVAFKSFLMACGFTEETISEITTKEQAYLDSQNWGIDKE